MTDDPVALLREAADKAPKGPWEITSDWRKGGWGVGSQLCPVPAATAYSTGGAEFIVAARNHLPAVLDEVERLRAQVAAVRKLHQPETTWIHCSNNCNSLVWPCDTARALGAPDEV